MYETWKKAGIFLGHAICIFIIVYCIAGDMQQSEASAKQVTATSKVTSIPTAGTTVTETPMPTETPIPTEMPMPTETPVPTETPIPIVTAAPLPEYEAGTGRAAEKEKVLQNIANGVYNSIENEADSWWFVRKEKQVPSGSGEAFSIRDYQGFYRNSKIIQEDKVLYLTIDCGYESDNTSFILDILKKHDVKVTFFVTNFFIEDSPKEVLRMVEEGHTVANHSVSHANLTRLTEEEIFKEIVGCEEAFYKLTGQKMAPYFRPPGGAYSKRTMQITEDLGYKTVFWSIAYRDYDINDQPGKQYVLDHFATYHHNGAIPLMHNDSDSNAEAMDELITYLKELGYRFGSLDELE